MSKEFNIPALISELPAEAIHADTLLVTINAAWVRNADSREQYSAMKAWFLARYCDPADTTPYSASEGRYLFVHGGPYKPEDVLFSEFGALVTDEVIQELSSDLEKRVGVQWAPLMADLSHGELRIAQEIYYDERFGIQVADSKKPFADLEVRLYEIGELLTLTGTQKAAQLVRRVAYSATITALETYFWERLIYAVENDNSALESIVANVQHFKDSNLKLSNIFTAHRDIEIIVKGYLQSIVWHRWDKVSPLIKYGLRITPPSFKPFVEPLIKRHDIVHRSGYTVSGKVIFITADEVEQLKKAVILFSHRIECLIEERDQLDFDDDELPF